MHKILIVISILTAVAVSGGCFWENICPSDDHDPNSDCYGGPAPEEPIPYSISFENYSTDVVYLEVTNCEVEDGSLNTLTRDECIGRASGISKIDNNSSSGNALSDDSNGVIYDSNRISSFRINMVFPNQPRKVIVGWPQKHYNLDQDDYYSSDDIIAYGVAYLIDNDEGIITNIVNGTDINKSRYQQLDLVVSINPFNEIDITINTDTSY